MIIKILNIVALIPLIIYPFILLANVMSFAGEKTVTTSRINDLSSYSFLIATTLYPLSVIISWKFNPSEKITIALIPFFHILLCIALFYIWSNSGKN